MRRRTLDYGDALHATTTSTEAEQKQRVQQPTAAAEQQQRFFSFFSAPESERKPLSTLISQVFVYRFEPGSFLPPWSEQQRLYRQHHNSEAATGATTITPATPQWRGSNRSSPQQQQKHKQKLKPTTINSNHSSTTATPQHVRASQRCVGLWYTTTTSMHGMSTSPHSRR